MVHTLNRMLLIVDSTDLIITPQLVCYRQWEPDLTELFWNSCRSDTVFVDVGVTTAYRPPSPIECPTTCQVSPVC